MKRSISKFVVISGILIQGASTPGFSMDQRVDFTRALPSEMITEILSYLSIEQLHEIHGSKDLNPNVLKSAEIAIKKEINEYLGEFILLPEVTAQDLEDLNQSLRIRGRQETTSITPMLPFRVAKSKASVGLYRAVMGHFPDLRNVGANGDDLRLGDELMAGLNADWENNLEFPVTMTIGAEDIAFANKLSRITGRRFRVIANSENEYSIRGRMLVDESPIGSIRSSTYFFGEDTSQPSRYCFFEFLRPNFTGRQHLVRGVHENPIGYSHPFKLNQAISNVCVRSSSGELRGCGEWQWSFMESSIFVPGYSNKRWNNVGFRLVEDI